MALQADMEGADMAGKDLPHVPNPITYDIPQKRRAKRARLISMHSLKNPDLLHEFDLPFLRCNDNLPSSCY